MVISNPNSNYTLYFIQKYTINDFSDYDRQVLQNQLKYGTLMGEARKAIQFAIQDSDDELIQFIKEFNKRKKAQQIQAESIKQQEALAKRNDTQVIKGINGILIDSSQILNPLKCQSKGRPPAKWLKSSVESGTKSSSKPVASDGGWKCGLCGGNGHYRNTCPVKT